MRIKTVGLLFSIGVILMYCLFGLRMPGGIGKARRTAEEYLASKYTTEMVFNGVRLSKKDPMMYHVSFSSTQDGILFEVLVNPSDYSLPKNPDNYVIQVVHKRMMDEFAEEVGHIWRGCANLHFASVDPLYSFQNTEGLSASASLSELSRKIQYVLYVDTTIPVDQIDVECEANRIYQFIQLLQKKEIQVSKLNVAYSGENKDRIYFSFTDCASYTTVEQVQGCIERG